MTEQTDEIGAKPRWEWQIAAGSSTAHVIDASVPTKRRGTRGWRSGPRALCKRYPQRNMEFPWLAAPVEWGTQSILTSLYHHRCMDCDEALAAQSTSPVAEDGA